MRNYSFYGFIFVRSLGRQLSMQSIKCVTGSVKIGDLGYDSVCVTVLHTSVQTIRLCSHLTSFFKLPVSVLHYNPVE